MAKILTEQFRRFSPYYTDPKQFGDGAALHSHVAYDLMRFINNRTTYGEPAYQVVTDMSAFNLVAPGPRAAIYRPTAAYPSSGTGMLGQWPIHVRPDAVRMCMSVGLFRRVYGGTDSTRTVTISELFFYLSSGPCLSLVDPIVPNPAPFETARQFDPKFIQGTYATFHDSLLPGKFSGASPEYACIQYGDGTGSSTAGWRADGAGAGIGGSGWGVVGTDCINDRTSNPWAWLILAVKYSGLNFLNEAITLGDVAVWFQYE